MHEIMDRIVTYVGVFKRSSKPWIHLLPCVVHWGVPNKEAYVVDKGPNELIERPSLILRYVRVLSARSRGYQIVWSTDFNLKLMQCFHLFSDQQGENVVVYDPQLPLDEPKFEPV
jgi:hypothetical protein